MALDAVFRDHWGRVLATLTGLLGDIELAEEAAAEAFAIAAARWPHDGEPTNPVGWLVATARNRAIDQHPPPTRARDQDAAARIAMWSAFPEAAMNDTATIPDERLELIFTCCHPALALDAQVALDFAHPRRVVDRGDRARVPRPVRDDEQTADTREAQDPRRPHPVRRAARSPTSRPTRGGPCGGVPDLQRRLGWRSHRSGRRRRSSSAAHWPR